MAAERSLFLIRHPACDVAPGVCYGRLDMGLAPAAAGQIAALLERLPRLEALVSSPRLRCAALAERLAQRDGLVLRWDERLAELDFGAWEGRRWDHIPRAEIDRWAQDHWRRSPPGGESTDSLIARTLAATEAALGEAAAGGRCQIGFVTHGGPMRALLAHARGGARQWPEDVIAHGSAIELRAGPAEGSDGARGGWIWREVAA